MKIATIVCFVFSFGLNIVALIPFSRMAFCKH